MPGRRTAALLLGPALAAAVSLATPAPAFADPPGRSLPVTVGRICSIIEREADRHGKGEQSPEGGEIGIVFSLPFQEDNAAHREDRAENESAEGLRTDGGQPA